MLIRIPEDSGNIKIINGENSQKIRLEIRPDNKNKDHCQWFNFIINGKPGENFVVKIENAGSVSYPNWNYGRPYRATASSDGTTWSRLDTIYDEEEKTLTICGALVSNNIQIAYFPPYPYTRSLELIEKACTIENCVVSNLGKSVEGRDITLLTIGTPGPDKKNIWVIAGQHPGEPGGRWFAEGLIERIASGEDLSAFFDDAVLYIVPNMNVDGTYHGNLRTNAAGKDLNRQWNIFDNEDTAPEVFFVRKAMLDRGVAAFFDVHSDETHPYVFPDGRGVGCSDNPEMIALEKEFLDAYHDEFPYLEKESKYEPDLPGQANLNIANAFFAQYLNCLSFVFETPNKELASGRDWTLQNCKDFGAHLIEPLIQIMPKLSNKFFTHQATVAGRASFFESVQAKTDTYKEIDTPAHG